MARVFVRGEDEGDDEMEPRRALPVPSADDEGWGAEGEELLAGGIPATAEEYMKMVSAEARRIPDVVGVP